MNFTFSFFSKKSQDVAWESEEKTPTPLDRLQEMKVCNAPVTGLHPVAYAGTLQGVIDLRPREVDFKYRFFYKKSLGSQ